MFELKEISSEKDIVYCVQSYASANDESFLPVHFETALSYVKNHWLNGAYLRILLKDSKPVGTILAIKGKAASHSNLNALIQNYYWCELQGFSAAKAAIFVHKELEKEAIKRRLPLVISTGSHMDETHQFAKILEKMGWERRGYIALKRLDQGTLKSKT